MSTHVLADIDNAIQLSIDKTYNKFLELDVNSLPKGDPLDVSFNRVTDEQKKIYGIMRLFATSPDNLVPILDIGGIWNKIDDQSKFTSNSTHDKTFLHINTTKVEKLTSKRDMKYYWLSFIYEKTYIYIPGEEEEQNSVSGIFATACLFVDFFGDKSFKVLKGITKEIFTVFDTSPTNIELIISVFLLLLNPTIRKDVYNEFKAGNDLSVLTEQTFKVEKSYEIEALTDIGICCGYQSFPHDALAIMNEDSLRDCPLIEVWYIYYIACLEAGKP